MADMAETMLHEWGLTWADIERTWTDEQLVVYADALGRRLARQAQLEVEKVLALARAFGADVSLATTREDGKTLEQALEAMGGSVEVI